MQQQVPEPVTTLLYRIETVEKEIAQLKTQLLTSQSMSQSVMTMEKDIAHLKTQLNLYEPTRESDLKLQRINDTVGRIETELSKVKEKIEVMNTHIVTQDTEAQKRDAAQRESQDKLLIRILWGIVSIVIAVLTAVLIGYLTHYFH